MPNLIDKNLQIAQDAIQQLTNNEVFYTGSTDLTGQGRNQVMDRNWQVCTSTPPPGESFTRTWQSTSEWCELIARHARKSPGGQRGSLQNVGVINGDSRFAYHRLCGGGRNKRRDVVWLRHPRYVVDIDAIVGH